MNLVHLPAALPVVLIAALLLPACSAEAPDTSVGMTQSGTASTPAAGTQPAPGPLTETRWEALIPADWDPQALFQGVDLNSFDDNDPRALDLMLKLRQAWDSAPVNQAMHGQPIRIPGYVVPLDQQAEGTREFLLVPYFGACVHTPPPPANQIIHVLVSEAQPLATMTTVWVSGQLEVMRSETEMGKAGYRVQNAEVKPFEG